MYLKREWVKYISKLEKAVDKNIVEEVIAKDKNELLYSELINKFKTGIFANRPNPVTD